MNWFKQTAEGVVINLRVVPRSSRNEICGVIGDALKIRLRAPPLEGKANKALVEFLSWEFEVSKKNISFLSGETCRTKRILISGITAAEVGRLASDTNRRGSEVLQQNNREQYD